MVVMIVLTTVAARNALVFEQSELRGAVLEKNGCSLGGGIEFRSAGPSFDSTFGSSVSSIVFPATI